MTTPAYVSMAEFDAFTQDEFGAVESGLRLADLLAAERRVNEYCARSFAAAPDTATARTFAPLSLIHI